MSLKVVRLFRLFHEDTLTLDNEQVLKSRDSTIITTIQPIHQTESGLYTIGLKMIIRVWMGTSVAMLPDAEGGR